MGKKGKAHGRAGQKKKAQRTSGQYQQQQQQKSTPRSRAAQLWDDDDDDYEDVPRSFQGFAQASSRTPQRMDFSVKLRHQKIAFVAAGSSTPAEVEEEELEIQQNPTPDNDEEEEEGEDDDDDIQINVITEAQASPPQSAMADMALDDPERKQEAVSAWQRAAQSLASEHAASQPRKETVLGRADGTIKATFKQTLRNQSLTGPRRPVKTEYMVTDAQGTRQVSSHNTTPSTSTPGCPSSRSLNPSANQFTPVTAQSLDPATTAPPSDATTNKTSPDGDVEVVDFIIDTVGDETLTNGHSNKYGKAPVRSPSPAGSSGSEKIVFRGRIQQRKEKDSTMTHKEISNRDYRIATGSNNPFAPKSPQAEEWKPASPDQNWEKKRLPIQPDFLSFAKPVEEGDPYGSQYIQRLRDQERQQKAARKSNKSKRRGKKGRKNDNRHLNNTNSDSDGLSEAAYDDYMQNLAAQLDKEDDEIDTLPNAEFINSASMFVDGKAIGDDELLDPNLKDDNEMDWTTSEQVGISSSEDDEDSDRRQRLHEREQFEKMERREERKRRKALEAAGETADDDDEAKASSDEYDSSTMDSSELEDALEYTEQEQWEDEQDLRDRAMERKTDEQLARLWAKQIDMGIDADELILDDGLYDADDGFGDVAAARQGLDGSINARATRTSRSKSKGFTFPNASALADSIDQYGEGGFDIMDFDRPSLRTPKKGRRGKLPAEVEVMSDESLKNDLANQWESDRRKKSLKKQEREELRAEGLLGSAGRKGVADLTQKYRDGMTMQQVKIELADFIQRTDLNARAFPPMAKSDRKALHEIASALKLNSKSMGSGKKRFPILTKTWATAEFDQRSFDNVFFKASRGQLKVIGNANKFKERSGPRRGGKAAGGGFDRSTALRNGEVVGAGAPEIGQNTFGHRMMEKMGWSKGTALGKDGEGRLDPVQQVMRTGRAGLG